MYNVQCTYDPVLIMLLISKFPSFSQLPTWILSMASHGIEYPIWLAGLGQPKQFLVKIDYSSWTQDSYLVVLFE